MRIFDWSLPEFAVAASLTLICVALMAGIVHKAAGGDSEREQRAEAASERFKVQYLGKVNGLWMRELRDAATGRSYLVIGDSMSPAVIELRRADEGR